MEKNIRLFFVLLLLFLIFFSLATDLPRRQNKGFFSDESGYFSIIQSLAYDLDIRYERKDLMRIKFDFPPGPVGFFLKKIDNDHYYYAKSFAYPLVAAPFYRLFSFRGILLCNGLMLFFALLMAYYLLKQYHPEPKSFSFALIFILASVTPIYLWWMTADLFNFFVMFAGLFFFFYRFKRSGWFYLAGVFFSFSVFSKPWNAAAIAIIYLILLYRKEWKRFILLALVSIIIFSSLAGFLFLQTGQLNYSLFQGGERRSFIGGYPYETQEPPQNAFARGSDMSFDKFWKKYDNSLHMAAINLFYYLFGRFTGMFIYFVPAFFVLVLFFFQRKVAEDWFVLAAIIFAIVIYTQLAADNYFGGSGSIGNRYFFNIFPLFFFLGFKNRIFKFSLIPALLGLFFLSGIYIDAHYYSSTPRYAGLSFPIRLFPPEKTQFLSLPTNENPRAFGQLIHDEDRTYQIYFINDHYHAIEGDQFWTLADGALELFLAAPQPVKVFRVKLYSAVDKNPVHLTFEYKQKTAILGKEKPYIAVFKNINGLQVKGQYIYHIKIKSDRYLDGYAVLPEIPDKRSLGVQVHIGVIY